MDITAPSQTTYSDARELTAEARRGLSDSMRDLDDGIDSIAQVVAALDERLSPLLGQASPFVDGVALRESDRDDVRSQVVRDLDIHATRVRDIAERARILLSRIDL